MDNKEYQTKIEELKKLHKKAQSKADEIKDQLYSLQYEYQESLIANSRSNFVGKYFKYVDDSDMVEYLYVRDIQFNNFNDSIKFVADKFFTLETSRIEMHVYNNHEWGYIKPENLVEITKEEFMAAYDNACKKMLSYGFGEPNQ